MILSREQILAAQDLRREKVAVPEWGGDVFVKALTGLERDGFDMSLIGADRKADLLGARAKLAVRCIVDENGERLFSDDDVPHLAAKSATALERIGRVAQRLNGMGDAELEDIKGN
jgi:hypothetical protein